LTKKRGSKFGAVVAPSDNPAGDAGDVCPPIFWLVGTSMGMSPPIFGVAM